MFSLRKFGLIVAVIALASLAGCGQYGRLYLPGTPLPRDAAQSPHDKAQDRTQQDDTQDSEFNAQPPALDKSRQP